MSEKNHWVDAAIQEALQQRPKTIDWEFKNPKLREIPEALFQMSFLEELDLTGHKITRVPPAVARMAGLRHLLLAGNPLQEVADVPGLVLDWAQWSRFSKDLNPNHVAGLQFNKGDPLDALTPEAFPALTRLELGSLDLKEIPEFLASMVNLTHLYLFNNQISEIPEFLASLDNLTYLSVGNQISEIPEFLASMVNLTHLDLFKNQISEIPEKLPLLPNLQVLDVRGPPPPGTAHRNCRSGPGSHPRLFSTAPNTGDRLPL